MSKIHEKVRAFEKGSLDILLGFLNSDNQQTLLKALVGLRKFVYVSEISKRKESLEIIGFDRIIKAIEKGTKKFANNEVAVATLAQEGVSWSVLFSRIEAYEAKKKMKEQKAAENKIKMIKEDW
jgi:hypothetical protein